ncbi:MAG: MBL fold metallo-hydrolase [Candidatus Pacebacteria bacterium]|nr:MBL fold metallo-hydrolase [Candidatus Paceibacterota bacterium]MCD8508112.1 MBL fold metallo-hydrolase [Candidatus Paceibacterota bacterium]MCD8527904.1 MBL fold metallo-hydrolase [Candidatus Paceibacterota bacterium]MCD8563747.1 MBL fold metallo-hydrolase [Candidatus Paceibacterota bacterium]
MHYRHMLAGMTLAALIWPLYMVYSWNGAQRESLLTVAFLDIGQGDAIFIETPSGHQVLVDAGATRTILHELGKVMKFNDTHIDLLIETHPDMDHIGGFTHILDRYTVDRYIHPGIHADTRAYTSLLEKIADQAIETTILHRGGRIVLDTRHGVYMDVLSPSPHRMPSSDRNEDSIVLRLVYGSTSFLLTGDAGVDTEKYMVRTIPDAYMRSTILKLGHHGSKTSTSGEFLVATKPEVGIISAGRGNRYGHPHNEVLENMRHFAVPYLATYENGTLVFTSNGREVQYTQ